MADIACNQTSRLKSTFFSRSPSLISFSSLIVPRKSFHFPLPQLISSFHQHPFLPVFLSFFFPSLYSLSPSSLFFPLPYSPSFPTLPLFSSSVFLYLPAKPLSRSPISAFTPRFFSVSLNVLFTLNKTTLYYHLQR